ncbi:ASTRA-associated protein-like protein [Emericellopsis cladophorae]|uniref:ASTRA-associated protein 1 n=1 Tax=Emericellopsis cladophorae TaxID=2686198 RepID=A0A9P9Y440_9HYPO|nr:ASTRA-associated protein-like protein [Emericellopsis cladophorae]KAI6782768.1 ASTRA-associated protein-like protein [Emericellopsis cladophorae]
MNPSAPPAPKSILRGHKSQVHASVFLDHDTTRLLTGDADGFVVLWDLTILRPRAVWRAHESAILGVRGWGTDKIITHGRDHKLIVWKLAREDEGNMSTALPLEEGVQRPQPWILHLLEVNTMNFCAFASCPAVPTTSGPSISSVDETLIAVPNTILSDAIDIWSLPCQQRIHTVQGSKDAGMTMALSLFHLSNTLTLIAAFENGYASVHRLINGEWTTTYRAQAHSQPILSIDVHPSLVFFLTSSADSVIGKHPIPETQQETITQHLDPSHRVVEEVLDEEDNANHVPKTAWKEWEYPTQTVNTKHSGQQGLRIRSDGRIFATAGWDSAVRVYSCKTMKELAVLKWHQVGCYTVAMANVTPDANESSEKDESSPSKNASGGVTTLASTSISVKDRRIHQAKRTHWMAAGAKDGRISLWDIY